MPEPVPFVPDPATLEIQQLGSRLLDGYTVPSETAFLSGLSPEQSATMLACIKQNLVTLRINPACSMSDATVDILCGYHDIETIHRFPIDWKFGGANGLHPGADPRWKPTTYTYFAEDLSLVHVTQTPLCDGEAVFDFDRVRSFGPSFKPMYLQAQRPDGTVEGLRYIYDWRSGTVQYTPAPGGDEHGSSPQES